MRVGYRGCASPYLGPQPRRTPFGTTSCEPAAGRWTATGPSMRPQARSGCQLGRVVIKRTNSLTRKGDP
jgi:hypothetical protein